MKSHQPVVKKLVRHAPEVVGCCCAEMSCKLRLLDPYHGIQTIDWVDMPPVSKEKSRGTPEIWPNLLETIQ